MRKRAKRDRAPLLACRHGFLASEVGLLRRDHVDSRANRIRITRLKGSLGGDHSFQPEEALALRSCLKLLVLHRDDGHLIFLSAKGKPVSLIRLHELMRRYGEQVGIPEEKRHLHALERSSAVHMLQADAREGPGMAGPHPRPPRDHAVMKRCPRPCRVTGRGA